MASLPMLKFSDNDVISYPEFLELCEGNISDKEFKWLKNIKLDEPGEGPLLKEWSDFYNQLLDELAIQRGKKLGRDIQANGSGDSKIISKVTNAVTQALGDGEKLKVNNPLGAEISLLSFMYDELDQMISLHTFDNIALAGYSIKLQLLNRKKMFSALEGQAEYKRLFSNMQSVIYNI